MSGIKTTLGEMSEAAKECLSPFQLFQLNKYGDILPEQRSMFYSDENNEETKTYLTEAMETQIEIEQNDL